MPPPDTGTMPVSPIPNAGDWVPAPPVRPIDHSGTEEQGAEQQVDEELSGLDALELASGGRPSLGRRMWSATWPKFAGAAILLGFWQVVVWSGWKPEYLLPSPATVLKALWDGLADGTLVTATRITLQRAAVGFSLALVIGTLLGAVISQSRFLRSAFGSLITGLQTMPSVAWFPLAILLFKITEGTILFVIVIGAAPSIANGLIGGTDQVPPLLVRAGKSMGAGRLHLYRHVILPAAIPSFVSGLKQGWAFSWRSLMAGELLVIVVGKQSIGALLQLDRDVSDAPAMMAVMILILLIGILVDAIFFGGIERAVRRRRGLEVR